MHAWAKIGTTYNFVILRRRNKKFSKNVFIMRCQMSSNSVLLKFGPHDNYAFISDKLLPSEVQMHL